MPHQLETQAELLLPQNLKKVSGGVGTANCLIDRNFVLISMTFLFLIPEEKKKEESESEDDDMGFGLFD